LYNDALAKVFPSGQYVESSLILLEKNFQIFPINDDVNKTNHTSGVFTLYTAFPLAVFSIHLCFYDIILSYSQSATSISFEFDFCMAYYFNATGIQSQYNCCMSKPKISQKCIMQYTHDVICL